MSGHSYHPDTHEFGLADYCERCNEHAAHPFESLDDENFAALLARIYRGEEPRSENEAEAMVNIRVHLRRQERLQRARKVLEDEEGR